MDFYRQDIYTFITYDDEIIGTNSLTFFDLSYDLSSYPYLSFMYPNEILNFLREQNLNSIITLQYFMVSPDYRYKKTGLNIARIIGSLSLKHMSLYNIDGTLTAARTQVGAAKVAGLCGFNKISEEKLVHNVPVVSMLCTKPAHIPESKEDVIIESLWEKRTSYLKGDTYELKQAA
ncbi:MAG: hypothetical protein ACRBBP_01995 [Bdellovibrionales bacterium]